MWLQSLIDLAGGIGNIQRILAPAGRVVISVTDPDKALKLPENVSGDWVNGKWQISLFRDENITDGHLEEIGRAIEHQQRQSAGMHEQPVRSSYRPDWHISPPQGLMNDPNGFIWHNGCYHLFYQWYPYQCEHKDKYWAHLSSVDLINWQWQPLALTPSDWYDSHGVFSGHAVSHKGMLYLFYTGNTRLGTERHRQTMQCLARSADGIHFEKLGPVIRELPPGVTEHIRDPKVIGGDGDWIMFLGAQTTERQGRLAVYHSSDLTDWRFQGLQGDELAPFGYMWECPDWFELAGRTFALFGPQGLPSLNPHHSTEHQNRIFRADRSEDGQIRFHDGWQLDAGFDFYAPQTLRTPDGRRVMCGWMGLPDEIDQPSCEHGWLHQMTAMRELTWHNGHIRQTPVAEMATLKGEEKVVHLDEQGVDLKSKSVEIRLTLQWGCELRLMSNGEHYASLVLDEQSRLLRFDHSRTQVRQGDTIRELPLSSETVTFQILGDHSSLEIFINEGEAVMTGRIFTPPEATRISLHGGSGQAVVTEILPATAPFAVP